MDEILSDKKPTFIKMDLQGHEAYALFGAKKIIETFHPVLAISVYHYVHDLWELPLMMKRLFILPAGLQARRRIYLLCGSK